MYVLSVKIWLYLETILDLGEEIEDKRFLPEESTPATSSDLSETQTVSSSSDDLDDFWKSCLTSSPVDKLARDVNGSSQIDDAELESTEDGTESNGEDSLEMSTTQAKPSKPLKRNKWKPEEIKKLIKSRGQLHSKFQVVKGRMALWKEVSTNLLGDGITRSPAQCKSLWASLVQKYEVGSLLHLVFLFS